MSTPPSIFDEAQQFFPRGAILGQNLSGQGATESSAYGSTVQRSDGAVVADFGSYAVPLFGHAPPEVVRAVATQIRTMPISSRTMLNPLAVRVAQRLVAALGHAALRKVIFTTTGSEAIEVAIKFARTVSRRSSLLAVQGGFHGKTVGSLALTDNDRYRAGSADILAPCLFLEPDDPAAVAKALVQREPAALVFEPIQGEGGVRQIARNVLERWVADCRQAGVFVIADEIQCGFGRCGPMSLAVEMGIGVDAVVFGKAMGGGVLPISAVVGTAAMFEPLEVEPMLHTSTFGGYPAGLAAAGAAINLWESTATRRSAVADQFTTALAPIRALQGHGVLDVRGRGMMWGIEFDTAAIAGEVFARLVEGRILVSPCLTRPAVLRLLPSVETTMGQVSHLVATIVSAVRA